MIANNTPQADHSERPEFKPGQMVRHRRYGYRGVVVHRDDHCRAEEAWYRSNQTQPDRDQPWYHVLVHDSSTITYAASENLTTDASGLAVDHPLLEHFFHGFENGAYVRNDRPWPGGA